MVRALTYCSEDLQFKAHLQLMFGCSLNVYTPVNRDLL